LDFICRPAGIPREPVSDQPLNTICGKFFRDRVDFSPLYSSSMITTAKDLP